MDRLGIIGAPSDWLISCHVDANLLKEKFDLELVQITTEELIELTKTHKEEAPEGLIKATFKKSELDLAYQIYLSILDLVKKYDLKGFTIRCFDLLGTIHSTSCLALALCNDAGIIGTCEGDVPAMISMYLVKKFLGQYAFQANPSEIDSNTSKITIAHCTLPLKMCTSYKLDTHFESGIGVAIKGELDCKDCFIFRISPDLDKYVILKGKIDENLTRNNLCRTQIVISVENNINYFLKNPLGNHHLVVYGHDTTKLEEYLKEKGLRNVVA